MLVQSAKVDAFNFDSITADILFCEVNLSAHIVFLEIFFCKSCFSFIYARILYAHLYAFY